MRSAGERTDPGRSLHRTLTDYFAIQSLLVPFFAIVLAVAIGSVIMLLAGENPARAYRYLLEGMFGSWDRTAASLARSTPFIGAALAVAFAFRAGMFNIGAEGQLLVGATAAAWVGTWGIVRDMWGVVAICVVVVAGAIGGGLWGAIPGSLKALTGAHEVIVTIMLNAIALRIVRWMVGSQDPVILRDELASRPQTPALDLDTRLTLLPPDWDWLPDPIRDIRGVPPLHTGFLVMLACCVLVWFVLQRTTLGFQVRAVGANPNAARYSGIRLGLVITGVMTMSGMLAGIAGAGEVAGTYGFLIPGVFLAVGFDSIAIALLARANPYAIVPAAVLWGSMLSGAPLMQDRAGVSIDIVRIVQALVILFVAADVIVRTLFRLRGDEEAPGALKEARAASWSTP